MRSQLRGRLARRARIFPELGASGVILSLGEHIGASMRCLRVTVNWVCNGQLSSIAAGMKYKNHMIFAALQLVDFTTTYVGLRHGATEGNALAVWSIHTIGLLPDLILCKLLAFAVSWILPDEHYALKIMNVLYGILMIWNIHLILRNLGL